MTRRLWLLPALALAAGCSSGEEEPAAPALTFHEVMKDGIDRNADALWDISNQAIGERAGIDPAKMNPNGSSLATGHPFAATGARIVATVAKELKQRGGGRALVSICTAGGMGVVAIVER